MKCGLCKDPITDGADHVSSGRPGEDYCSECWSMYERLHHVDGLVEAVLQCLDDMGVEGRCVCEAAKAQLRLMVEPFLLRRHEVDYQLGAARAVLDEIKR